LDSGHLRWLKGTKSKFLDSEESKAEVTSKWEKEASQKDRLYILSGVEGGYVSDTVYYVQD
jgi:CRISPR/Cas system CSM-associated protein Csm5 (group 7 of RAMP superfamily)